MSHREELLTPVGRLVRGSLYDPQTTDANNQPKVYKTGPQAGQIRTDYYFAIAIAKGAENFWFDTPWGQKIYKVAVAGFPQGQYNAPDFAWKVIDGDSPKPNKVGKKPCECEGYPGHWVLNFSSGFAPGIYNADGTQQLLEPHHVNLGDYIQVAGSVADNESLQQPGVYLNHSMIAFAGYGKRIVLGPDPKSVGFGQGPLPAGVSSTPLPQGFNPAPAPQPTAYMSPTPPPSTPVYTPPVNGVPAYIPPVAPVAAPPPYTAILTPPVPPAAPVRNMTAKAAGQSYDAFIAGGWTHDLLIQHGYLIA